MKVVQIGTNDGEDDVNRFCKQERPEFILLVEPFDYHTHKIKKNYAEIMDSVHLETIAIHPTENLDSVTLYYAERNGPAGRHNYHHYEVASIISEHVVKHGYSTDELKSFSVPAVTLSTLFDKYSLSVIDYLFLDIEGIDFEVLRSINFEKYDIKHLQIEHLHLNKNELVKFMEDKGYKVAAKAIDTTGYDTLFDKL